jgi:hypothetical protein
MRNLIFLFLIFNAAALAANDFERGISIQAMPKGLTVAQAADWVVEGTCLTVVVDTKDPALSENILDSVVDYGRFSLRDYVSLDTALLLLVPQNVRLIVDQENGLVTYRPAKGGI